MVKSTVMIAFRTAVEVVSGMAKIARIISGGQTGVDRAALDAARFAGIPICGWCPRGGWAEDLPAPPGLLSMYPELIETESAGVEQRTKLNVRDSHATLIIAVGPRDISSGTAFTIDIAKLYRRPYFVADNAAADDIAAWLCTLGEELTLNIAGPRESKSPGIYEKSYRLLKKLLSSLAT